MDIIIRLSPRRIERAISILIIIALISSNIYFYRNQVQATAPIEEQQETQQTTEQTTTQTTTTDDTSDTTEKTTTEQTGDCTEGWGCYKPYYKGYQNSDCSWDNTTLAACINGCEDGECVADE